MGEQQDGKDTDAELHRFAEFVARERALLGVGESGEHPRDAEPVVISGAAVGRRLIRVGRATEPPPCLSRTVAR